MNKINIAFDMETSDPDDVFTLCILAHHPNVNLVSVTVTPGSKHQIGLIKHILNKLELSIPVGSKNKNHAKQCVSEFHYKWLGIIPPAEPDGEGKDILFDAITSCDNLTIVSGAALGNIGALLDKDILINKMVIQGGFAGDNIVAEHLRLDKFKGKITCPTFNLNGDVNAALKVFASDKISERRCVSKNVCHGVVYDLGMHKFIEPFKNKNLGLSLLFAGMEVYLNGRPSGKAFHDPLAACVAIDNSICDFVYVELYRERGEWGSRYSDHPNTYISVSVDMEKFKNTIIG